MKQKEALQLREGSATAEEIYLSVGVALSWWESSEDVREMLFAALCGQNEPVASETFLVAGRPGRSAMLKSAVKNHSATVAPEQAQEVTEALDRLEKLAFLRNQIAHGYVSKIHQTVDGELIMRGHFLVSTLNPNGVMGTRESNKAYALTAAEINDWTKKVRQQRGRLLDVWMAIAKKD